MLFTRGLVGEVGTLARVGVILGEGSRIWIRRDLAQGGLARFGFIWPIHLIELLLCVLIDVVGALVRGRRSRSLHPRRGEERFESYVEQISRGCVQG